MQQNDRSSSTSLETKVLQAIEEIKIELGETFSLDNLNLAELERRTGVSRMNLFSRIMTIADKSN